MTERTARFDLPFILPGQAQKETFHNEALALVDLLLHAAVEGDPQGEPPGNPQPGQAWLVGDEPQGAWAGSPHAIAGWTGGGWRFAAPQPGMTVWSKAAGHALTWNGAEWGDGSLAVGGITIGGEQVVGARQPTVPSPWGGTTIDAEARAAVDQIIVALRTHGLID